MHFTLPLLACVASMSLAAPIATPNDLAARDSAIIERAISRSQTSLVNLAKTIDAYYFTPTRNPTVQQKMISDDSQGAVEALDAGARLISTSPHVREIEKPGVVIHANQLLDQIRKVSDSWVRAKGLIVVNGGKQAIGEVVRQQARAANGFASALVSKMPGGERDAIANWYEREVNQAVTKSVVAFS